MNFRLVDPAPSSPVTLGNTGVSEAGAHVHRAIGGLITALSAVTSVTVIADFNNYAGSR